jgi:hypothetical protein
VREFGFPRPRLISFLSLPFASPVNKNLKPLISTMSTIEALLIRYAHSIRGGRVCVGVQHLNPSIVIHEEKRRRVGRSFIEVLATALVQISIVEKPRRLWVLLTRSG